MRINFDGAAQTVTGSQHLLNINGHNLLLECGLFQGKRQESYERNHNFPFDPTKIDAVILTHAHIDHSGNLPNLVKQGFSGPIYTTPATAHLANLMLMDSGHIQESDVEFVNKRRKNNGEAPLEPLYSQVEAGMVAQYFSPVNYGQAFEPIEGVQSRILDAGHILGSGEVVLDIEEHMRKVRVWFSGDIGRRGLPLIRDPILPDWTDYLIMECTYGDQPHPAPEQAFNELHQAVKRTLERGGKVIIPAFAVGRTQEIVYALHQMFENHQLPSVPVYVDSPLAVNASDIFKMHPECFDEETKAYIKADKHHTALGFERLIYTRSVEESKALNDRKDPMIIISASGMAETGRILHHLRNNIGNPRNTILIVSWQAPDTLGRRLADGEKRVRIFGEEFAVKAEVVMIRGFSAHAGQDFLMEYAQKVKERVKQIFLVHGEFGPAEALSEKLVQSGMNRPAYPQRQESVEL